MSRSFVRCIFLLLALIAPSYSHAQAQAQSTETSTEKKIDAIFSAVTSPGAPGLAVLVRQNGKTVFERGYGVASP